MTPLLLCCELTTRIRFFVSRCRFSEKQKQGLEFRSIGHGLKGRLSPHRLPTPFHHMSAFNSLSMSLPPCACVCMRWRTSKVAMMRMTYPTQYAKKPNKRLLKSKSPEELVRLRSIQRAREIRKEQAVSVPKAEAPAPDAACYQNAHDGDAQCDLTCHESPRADRRGSRPLRQILEAFENRAAVTIPAEVERPNSGSEVHGPINARPPAATTIRRSAENPTKPRAVCVRVAVLHSWWLFGLVR